MIALEARLPTACSLTASWFCAEPCMQDTRCGGAVWASWLTERIPYSMSFKFAYKLFWEMEMRLRASETCRVMFPSISRRVASVGKSEFQILRRQCCICSSLTNPLLWVLTYVTQDPLLIFLFHLAVLQTCWKKEFLLVSVVGRLAWQFLM